MTCYIYLVVLVFVPLAIGFLVNKPLKLASFNIQVFGRAKWSSPEIRSALDKILSRYDIVQVLEIRDLTDTVFEKLRQSLNVYDRSQHGSADFQKVVSGRLGRSSSKEQYGFLYRSSRVSVLDAYQYTDRHDYYERPPFGVKFSSPSTVITDFGMVAAHIKPSDAVNEIGNLSAVYSSFNRHWHLQNIILGGDFNADCGYVSHRSWAHLPFRHDHRFTWLLDDNLDTTVGHTDCSYDKFVVHGHVLQQAIVPHSARVYRFDEVMGMSKDAGLHVSDHYPIEMQILAKCKLPFMGVASFHKRRVRNMY